MIGILAQELFYRAGGLVPVNPVLPPGLTTDIRPVTLTSRLERLPGFGAQVLALTAHVAALAPIDGPPPVVLGEGKLWQLDAGGKPLTPGLFAGVSGLFQKRDGYFDNLVTGGEPGGSTEILITQAYKFAFQKYQYGYAAAYATIIFGILRNRNTPRD